MRATGAMLWAVYAAAGLVLAGALALFYATSVEPQMLAVNHYPVDVPGEGGLEVAFVADVHMRTPKDMQQLEKVVVGLNEADADYNIIAGDVIDGYRKEIAFLEPLKNIKNKNHTLIVLGNHDYGHGWDDPSVADNLTAWFQENGFRVLRNQHIEDGGVCFVGLDDPWAFRADVDAAYEGVGDDCVVVLISHNPDMVYELGDKRTDLILAGHTHGGQVCFPFIEAFWIPAKIRENCGRGFYDISGRRIFITKGVWGYIRFNAAPEIAVMELT